MSGIICETCGRDIDALGQDDMSCTSEPLCEDCWNVAQSHAVAALKRENARLREKLDAKAEDAVDHTWVGRMRSDGPADCKRLRREIETAYEASRERALALTRLDECEMWLGRCEPKETAAPAAAGAAQEAAMPCLKDDEAHGFKLPDASVEVKAEATAEKLAKSLRESMRPAMRMAVE